MTTPTDTDLAQVLRLLIVAHEEVLGDGLTSFNEPVELRRAKQALAAHESRAQPDRNPDGCAYRYRCPDGGTVIRFNHGEAVNGSKPIETIPFYYGQPPAQPASVAGGAKVIAQFVAERVSMGRGDERYIGTADGSLGVTVRYGDPGEVRNDLLWLIADAILAAAPQPAKDEPLNNPQQLERAAELVATNAESKLVEAGVFKGNHGLRGLLGASAFWERQPYGTRLYYGDGIADYLHRDVLDAAVKLLDARPPEPARDAKRDRYMFIGGWRTAADWARRPDLISDIGSPAWEKELAAMAQESGDE